MAAVPPYEIDILNGELGVTSLDMSQSTGIPLDGIEDIIRKKKWHYNNEWHPPTVFVEKKGERTRVPTYAFTLISAFAFLCRMDIYQDRAQLYASYISNCYVMYQAADCNQQKYQNLLKEKI